MPSRPLKKAKPAPCSQKRAIAITRVSTDRQELGPEAQKAAIIAWAEREGVEIVEWFHEVESGNNEFVSGRRTLLTAIAALKSSDCGWLAVAKRDRLGRLVRENALAEALVKEQGARIVCADTPSASADTPEAQFFRHIFDAVAQLERARIALRITEALAVKRARGERLGAIPYGWDVSDEPGSKLLVKREDEQTVIKLVRTLYAKGKTLPEINGDLRKNGLKSREGVAFRTNQLERMLTQEMLAMEAKLKRGKPGAGKADKA